jgi:5-methylcytosine-specific restriction endonuclease McrA
VTRRREQRSADPDAARSDARRYYAANPGKKLAAVKRCRDRLRVQVIEHYGGQCACCGEDDLRFLTIEHRAGVPESHRDAAGRRKTGYGLLVQIVREGFPASIEVLCFNCNQAKGIYGECPHRLTLREVVGAAA